MQFLLTLFWGEGEEQEASALLSKKGGREWSIESQQKLDFFSYDERLTGPYVASLFWCDLILDHALM